MSITLAKRLQKLQNRAARVIACQGYEARSIEMENTFRNKK